MTHFLYSLITFSIALFFILFGIIGIILPLSTGMQALAIDLILQQPVLIFLFGISMLAIGVVTALNIMLGMRRHYFHIKVQGKPVSVDSALIHSYVKTYLEDLFPGKEIPFQLQIKKNKISVTVDLPAIEENQQSALLDRISDELRELFTSFLGYKHHFHLSASFQPMESSNSPLAIDE